MFASELTRSESWATHATADFLFGHNFESPLPKSSYPSTLWTVKATLRLSNGPLWIESRAYTEEKGTLLPCNIVKTGKTRSKGTIGVQSESSIEAMDELTPLSSEVA